MRRKDKMIVEVAHKELASLLGHPDWAVEDVGNKTEFIYIVLTKEWRDDGS